MGQPNDRPWTFHAKNQVDIMKSQKPQIIKLLNKSAFIDTSTLSNALRHRTIRRSIPTDGTLLGALPRENSRETRFSWTSHHGNYYVRVQDFQFDVRDETWAPVKGRCFTVRIHELASVADFIKKAINLAIEHISTESEIDHIEEINDICVDLNSKPSGSNS
jgi:hypothetical protein